VRVLLVADFYPPAPGGLEAHVRRLGHGLRQAGHEVAVLAGGRAGPPVDDDGVPVYSGGTGLDRLPFVYRQTGRAFHPPWPDRRFQRDLTAVLDRFDPQVVHAHGWCEFSVAAACRGRTPVVVTLHDHGLCCPKKNLLRGDRECARGRGLRCATCPGAEQGTAKRSVLAAALAATTRQLPGRVARFVAVSDHVARRARAALAAPVPIEVVPNFFDLPSAQFTEPDGTQVLYVGPADRHKGLPVLLDAWQRVPPDAGRLVVVGATGSAPGVEFVGRLGGDPLWQRYRQAALVVAPSIWPEPCPTVVLEAMAWGRPVVGSRIGGIPDLVEHDHTGLLVPPRDPAALASAITDLLADPSRRAAMAKAAWMRARSFDTTVVVDRLAAVYAQVRAEWDAP
jgi:glycosyltransferase involved in cell wall biosynthesis